MPHMGFVQKPQDTVKLERDQNNILLLSDSNNSISFDDATFHTIVLGTTGSGKTSNVIFPALLQFLKHGSCGLIVDIKGNLRDQVFALAKVTGRENDLIEYGTSSSASPLNLMANMEYSEILESLKTLTTDSFQGRSGNLDFHLKGVGLAASCAQLLIFLAKKHSTFSTNYLFVSQMINDPALASELYQLFLDTVFEEKNDEHIEFTKSVESAYYHIFHFIKRQKESSREIGKYLEQLNYCLDTVRIGLNQFITVQGVVEGFAKNNAKGLDFKTQILSNKIIVLRFDPESGPIGSAISRTLIEKYYETIFSLGVEVAVKHPSFICLDEFQEVANLTASRFSDARFISLAREFNASFLASTQSVSALLSSSIDFATVDSFISNCNNRIIFYSDDPKTQNIVDRHTSNIYLNDFKSNQAFMTHYISETRTHEYGLETFQNIYEKTKALIDANKVSKSRKKKRVLITPLRKILKKKLELLEAQKAKITEQKAKAEEKNRKKLEPASLQSTEIDYEKITETDEEKAMNFITKAFEDSKSADPTENQLEDIIDEDPIFLRIKNEFPQFFANYHDEAENKVKTVIPKGWYECVRTCFISLEKLNIDISISSLFYYGTELSVRLHNSPRHHSDICQIMVEELLSVTKNICPLCGTYIKKKKKRGINICSNCHPISQFSHKKEINYEEENKISEDITRKENKCTL